MNRWGLDLLLVGGTAVVCMISAVTTALDPALRLVLAVTLVAVLPGYALTALLLARHPKKDRILTTAMSMGLSLALSAVGGVVLHLSPGGLRAEGWSLLLGGITLIACAFAADLRRRDGTAAPPPAVTRGLDRRSLTPTLLLFGSALVLGAAAILVAQQGARDQPRPGFTQMWLTRGVAEGEVTVGIHNQEGRAILVRLILTTGSSVVAEFPSVMIPPADTWTRTLTVAGGQPEDEPLVATLFQVNEPDTVFRLARLWPT